MSSIPTGSKKITIIGAGMCGPLMALYLARRGHEVELFDRRPDPRDEAHKGERSIKMTLAEKGLRALREVGLAEKVLERTIPLRGRAIHHLDSSISYQLYGKDDREVIHSITRTDLNIVLLDEAEACPNVRIRFGARCARVDKEKAVVSLVDQETGERFRVRGDVVIGADGAYSVVRRWMHRGERADYHQEFLAWGYKALTIAAGADGEHRMDRHALHLWPRGDHILFALPNLDGSFNAVCTLPHDGADGFGSFRDDEDVLRLFRSLFPDALPLIPDLLERFRYKGVSKFLTIRTSRWHHGSKVVLLGDACHTVVPFYGQGMNAALNDCAVLDECIERHPRDWGAAFAEYQAFRKPHTDTLAELSNRNFVELRDTSRSAWVAARKKSTLWLNRVLSSAYVPIYTLVTHTTLPYAECVSRAGRQDRILRRMGFDLVVGAVAAGIGTGRLWRRMGAALRRRTEPAEAGPVKPVAPQAAGKVAAPVPFPNPPAVAQGRRSSKSQRQAPSSPRSTGRTKLWE